MLGIKLLGGNFNDKLVNKKHNENNAVDMLNY
jgi:hypothetical protein